MIQSGSVCRLPLQHPREAWDVLVPTKGTNGKVLAFHKVDPPLYFSSPFLLYSLDKGYIFDAHNLGIYELPFTSLRYTFIRSLIGTH